MVLVDSSFFHSGIIPNQEHLKVLAAQSAKYIHHILMSGNSLSEIKKLPQLVTAPFTIF
jgi:hypothetical protein